ncbi:hypothetical protein TgHK011_006014 [Trichoderma gracile]|nr:hypothetical protein TgHK011_006014 [Trichoderma gracile]
MLVLTSTENLLGAPSGPLSLGSPKARPPLPPFDLEPAVTAPLRKMGSEAVVGNTSMAPTFQLVLLLRSPVESFAKGLSTVAMTTP